jgi:hypothetical protein
LFSDVLFAAASRDNLQHQNQNLNPKLDVHAWSSMTIAGKT